MTDHRKLHAERRAFLRRAGHLALVGSAAPLAINLAAFGEAAAFDASDYKALVCVFLNGGNDHANTLIPYDLPNYDRYSAIRGGGADRTAGGIALARADLAATVLEPASSASPLAHDLTYALHPSLAALRPLFDEGRLAIQLNVGPLVTPTTKAQYLSGDRIAHPLPPRLFSHNDQQSIWQSSSPEGSTAGWGGQLGDLALASNGEATFTCVSVTGNAVFLAGDTALPYAVTSGGAVAINAAKSNLYGSAASRDVLRSLVQKASSHMLENEYARVTSRSIASEGRLSAAIASTTPTTVFPATPLGNQLRMVARIIGARAGLGAKRQVFMVSLGGFDLHDNLISQHPALLSQVGDALAAFYRATQEFGVADKVCTFTASDFGRTLTSNGDGSDHGWGGHHFVLGGAVRGQRFYGSAPAVEVDGSGDVGQGRLLPTTSVAQFAATLAKWFGVSAAELPTILPNLSRFGGGAWPKDLGFLG